MASRKGSGGPDSSYELALLVSGLQSEVDDYKCFAEEVLLMCAMPEVERFALEGRFEGHVADDAMVSLLKLLSRYRTLLSFLRSNHIDVDKIFNEDKDKPRS